MRFLRSGFVLALTSVLLLSPLSALAQYTDIFGFGSREISMGGAMTAEAEGPGAAFYNPGALIKTKKLVTSMGFSGSYNNLKIRRLGNIPQALCAKNLDCDPFLDAQNPDAMQGIQLGLALPLSKNIVFGTATNLPTKGLSTQKFGPPNESYWLDYESRANTLDMKLAVAYAPTPWLGVGVGLIWLANIQGDFLTNLPIGAGNPTPQPAGPIVFSSELELNHNFAPTAGIYVKPIDFLQVGLAYRGELAVHADLDLFITSDLNQGAGITQFIPLKILTTPLYTPQEVSFGVSLKPSQRLTVAADVTWVDWSQYEAPTTNIIVGQLGSTTFGGVPFPAGSVRLDVTPVTNLRFKDIFVPRIGVEFRPMEWLFLRGGYYFRESPVPVQAGLTNVADANTHVFSGGIGVLYDDPLQVIKAKTFIDLHAQIMLLETEKNIKVPNLAVNDPSNEGLPGYEEGGMLYTVGITTGLKF